MSAFYFTYGNDEHFPYQGGWSLVLADDYDSAVRAFETYHPRSESQYGNINCAEIYTSEGFLSTKMATEGNFGARCHEIIKLNRLMFEDTKGGVSHE